MKRFELFTLVFVVCFALMGCSQANEEKADVPEQETSVAEAVVTLETPVVEDFEINEDAPFVSEKYPNLASGGLMYARLDDLPEGVLLRAGSVKIESTELDEYVAQAPAEVRDELRKSGFFILEQLATDRLLLDEVKKSGITGRDDNAIIKTFADDLIKSVEVSDEEIKTFYDNNKEMMGGMPFDKAESQIRRHLLQGKQQEIIKKHIEEMGKRFPIAVSAVWTEKQAELAADNPVDKARASGKPTFVNFGAKGCVPCDMMEPIREEMKIEYEGRLNVVFVHVNQDRILASRYGISGIPHLVFFDKDGKEVHTHTGFMPKEDIEEWLEKIGVMKDEKSSKVKAHSSKVSAKG